MTVNVSLSGKLVLDGYGQGHPTNGDGTYQLALRVGSTVQDVIHSLGVPFRQIQATGHKPAALPPEVTKALDRRAQH